jgi:hypothetical protein
MKNNSVSKKKMTGKYYFQIFSFESEYYLLVIKIITLATIGDLQPAEESAFLISP